MYEDTLLNIGLTQKEAKMYEFLLKMVEYDIKSILKNTDIKRGDLYNILASLQDMGLIEVKTKDKKKLYLPKHPQFLGDLLKDQEKEVVKSKKELEAVLPELTSMFKLISGKPGIRYFEGKEGFKEALFDSLSATEPVCTIFDEESLENYAADIDEKYYKKVLEKKLEKKILIINTEYAQNVYKKEPMQNEFIKLRILPKIITPFKTGMQIYNNKTAYFTLRKENIIAIIIEDADIYQMNKNIFEFLWLNSDPIG